MKTLADAITVEVPDSVVVVEGMVVTYVGDLDVAPSVTAQENVPVAWERGLNNMPRYMEYPKK